MKNVTITLDEELARWARIRAAEEDTSVSRLVGRLLRQHMNEQEAYEVAMRRFLSRKPTALKREGKYPRREELHERTRLR
jgi:hypothetical protein